MSVPFQIVLYPTRISHIAHHFKMPLDTTAFEMEASFYIKGDINSILMPDFIYGQTDYSERQRTGQQQCTLRISSGG